MCIRDRCIYNRRRRIMARTTLNLEIGNGRDSVILPIAELMHSPLCCRFIINKSEITLRMIEKHFSAELFWSKGVLFSNSVLDLPILLPESLHVPFWKIKLLKSDEWIILCRNSSFTGRHSWITWTGGFTSTSFNSTISAVIPNLVWHDVKLGYRPRA